MLPLGEWIDDPKEDQMRRRTLAWVVLASFLLFSWSCYSWQKQPVRTIKPEQREGTEVSAVQMKSGKKIYFNTNTMMKIMANHVVGENRVYNLQVEKAKIKEPKDLNIPAPFTLTTTDGSVYEVASWTAMKDAEDKILVNGYLLKLPL